MNIKEYVKKEFYELPEKHWSDEMVKSFIIYSSTVDTDTHEEITDIDHDDVIEAVKEFDLSNLINHAGDCWTVYTSNAKQVIKRLICDIEEDLENCTELEDQRQEFDATEARGINNER